jgi:hypothetical protein
MIDPVMRDLDRHLASIDKQDAIDMHAESLREEDPDHYATYTDEEMHEIARSDLEDRATEAKIDAYLDERGGW